MIKTRLNIQIMKINIIRPSVKRDDKAARMTSAWNKLDPNKDKHYFIENTTSRKHTVHSGRGISYEIKRQDKMIERK